MKSIRLHLSAYIGIGNEVQHSATLPLDKSDVAHALMSFAEAVMEKLPGDDPGIDPPGELADPDPRLIDGGIGLPGEEVE